MVQYDFSQLPVMQGEREVKGVVSWKSIGLRKALGSKCERVGDCQEDARIVDSDRTLFDSIPLLLTTDMFWSDSVIEESLAWSQQAI